MDKGTPNIRENRCLTEEYVRDIERRGKQEAAELSTGDNPMGLLDKLMEIQGNTRLSNGSIYWKDDEKKQKLENLANTIINNEYGSIISAMDVDLDIKLVGGDNDMDDARNEMAESPEEMEVPEEVEEDVDDQTEDEVEDVDEEETEDNTPQEEDEDFDDNTEVEEETDEDILLEVDKRKLINNIIQGSAKNTHRLIHLYKNEIDEIDPELFDVMDKLIKNNEAQEWLNFDPDASLEGTGKLIKDNMNGYSDIDFPEEESDCDGDCDMDFDDDDFENLLNDENKPTKPVLRARAIDIVVLLHESVKALYEYISAAGIPEDPEIANYVLNFTDTLDNEFVDLKYGVYLRRDLLDFINVNEKILDINNGFEYVYGRLVELEPEYFVKLMNSIYIEENRKDIFTIEVRSGEEYISIVGNSRHIVDEIVEIISNEIDAYEEELAEYERNLNEWEAYEKFMEENPDYDENADVEEYEEDPEEVKEVKLSKRDVQSEIDRIIDEEDLSDPDVKKQLDKLSSMY